MSSHTMFIVQSQLPKHHIFVDTVRLFQTAGQVCVRLLVVLFCKHSTCYTPILCSAPRDIPGETETNSHGMSPRLNFARI